MSAEVELISTMVEKKAWTRPPIQMEFQVESFGVSEFLCPVLFFELKKPFHIRYSFIDYFLYECIFAHIYMLRFLLNQIGV